MTRSRFEHLFATAARQSQYVVVVILVMGPVRLTGDKSDVFVIFMSPYCCHLCFMETEIKSSANSKANKQVAFDLS